MKRVTISLPADLLTRVNDLATARGISVSAFIRQAVEEKVAGLPPKPRSIGIAESTGPGLTAREASELRPGPPRSLGIFASGHLDTSELASDWPVAPRTWRSS
jgi:hypothetical protein